MWHNDLYFNTIILSYNSCLKKYCVCFAAQIQCGADKCKCNNCKNPHGTNGSAFNATTASGIAASNIIHQMDNRNKSRNNDNTTAAGTTAPFCTVIRVPSSKDRSMKFSQNKLATTTTNTTTNQKWCQCSKSKCLKLYCDCFRQSAMCSTDCQCQNCKNTTEFDGPEGDRTMAREEIMKLRGPSVFEQQPSSKKKSVPGCSCQNNR